MQYIHKYNSLFGEITIASNGDSLTGLWFVGQKHFASTLEESFEECELPIFTQTIEWLDSYFAGATPTNTPKLELKGSPFQMAVWDILQQIPYGQLISYKAIAHQIALQRGVATISAQAVGGAVGRNPISIIIPCHRVVGSNGSLTGYAGGLALKTALLNIERNM